MYSYAILLSSAESKKINENNPFPILLHSDWSGENETSVKHGNKLTIIFPIGNICHNKKTLFYWTGFYFCNVAFCFDMRI